MILTNKQEEALRTCVSRFQAGEKYTVISGFAGSGKSTVIKFIIEALGVDPNTDVAYATYTGRAAQVLRQKGCANACTLHRLLYHARLMPNGSFKFTAKSSLEYKIVVVDEVSMCPKEMWDLLCSHKVYIIASGDPGQLGPVFDKTKGNTEALTILNYPHVFLDEIMRQAQESEIIRLSMDIRANKPIIYHRGQEVMVVRKNEVSDGMYTWADQILCAKNDTRRDINNKLRAMQGFGPEPQAGDKIICCRNDWDTLDTTGESCLVNGTIGYLKDFNRIDMRYPIIKIPDPIPLLISSFTDDQGHLFEDIPIDYASITTGIKSLNGEQEGALGKSKTLKDYPKPIEFNYGYAITTHRAQGSSFGKILVFEESYPFNVEEKIKWLYTAVTRAENRVVLVR